MNNKRSFHLTVAFVAILVLGGLNSCKKSVTSVTLDKTTLTLEIGETAILVATVLPQSATNQAVTWASSNPAVATVVPSGLVTALSEGKATIVVTTQDGNKVANCVVTVIPPPHPAEPELVFVEGGTFTMGCTDGACFPDGREEPAHQVTVSSFKMAKYLVTQKQWVAVMGTNPSQFKGDNLPVDNVNWDDAQEFIRRLNDSTKKQYRLPTEAEWEYAARGGKQSKGYKYSGSNDINAVAWYSSNSNGTTHAVGTKAPNELGIYDMSGNLLEWCSDWYGANYYSVSPQNNPTGPSSGSFRVDRGGSWSFSANNCRVSMRGDERPNNRRNFIGFRLVHP